MNDNEFCTRPQDREIEGNLFYSNRITNVSGFASKAYSIPMERCIGCPLYKVDKNTEPTSYYCKCDFVSSYTLSKAVEDLKVPESCKITQVERIRNYPK